MLVRVLNMRGVNLRTFDFDYDLEWAGLFMNADGKVYGRFGGRDAESPDKYLTLPALRHALERALAAHRAEPPAAPVPEPPADRVEDYAAARRLPARACIHCHQVFEFRREVALAAGTWDRDHLWVYPPPETVGLSLDPDGGDRVRGVALGSAAARAGLREGDELVRIADRPVASVADVQYSLHHAPSTGSVPVVWRRAGQLHDGSLTLAPRWKEYDVSWRASLRRFGPAPCVDGEDLEPDEKRALGLPDGRLAFRQSPFMTAAARQAGVRAGDVILGVDGKQLEMTARQFETHIRLNYHVGDVVTLNVLRGGRPVDVPLKLPARTPY